MDMFGLMHKLRLGLAQKRAKKKNGAARLEEVSVLIVYWGEIEVDARDRWNDARTPEEKEQARIEITEAELQKNRYTSEYNVLGEYLGLWSGPPWNE